MSGMKLTLQPLPDAEQARKLKANLEAFDAACDWLAGEAFSLRLANKVKLRKANRVPPGKSNLGTRWFPKK